MRPGVINSCVDTEFYHILRRHTLLKSCDSVHQTNRYANNTYDMEVSFTGNQ